MLLHLPSVRLHLHPCSSPAYTDDDDEEEQQQEEARHYEMSLLEITSTSVALLSFPFHSRCTLIPMAQLFLSLRIMIVRK